MILGIVKGTVVATRKMPELVGYKLSLIHISTIYVKNSATKAGVGMGGEGHCTMTIAGPTGEGITCAKSFCRRRRCMLAEGGLRIILSLIHI